MAHGHLNPTDLRTERNFLGDIAGAIGNRIGKSSNMARKERAFASKKAEEGGTSLEEAGIGRGYFFKRALGSSFGGDKIARTRGRFESDPGPGRDPTGTQASRFRGGFDYGVTNEIFGSAGDVGGALSALSGGGFAGAGGGGGGVAQKLLEAGPQAINPEVLGGEVAKYQGTKTNAAGFSVDTTATEIKDIAGILNQIGQIIVRSNNTTVQAIDSVQRVNIKVVDSVQNLGQLQVGIAERQLQQQMMLASSAEDTQEQIAARQLAAAEKSQMAQQGSAAGSLDPQKSGFRKGGILGNMFGGMGRLLDTGLSMLGGGRGGIRGGAGRMSRAGRRAQRAQGLSTANAGGVGIRGMNFRNNSMTGGQLSTNRILAGDMRPGSLGRAQDDITRRYAQRYGQKAAMKRFGSEGLQAAGMTLSKGARVAKFLSPVMKRVPIVGGLLDFGINLAMGEPIGKAAAKGIGATLGATLGSFVPIPGVGTILGGIVGDMLGGVVYNALQGSKGETTTESLTPFASGGIITRPTAGLVGEAGKEGVFPLEGAKGKETFLMFGEGILDAQKNNKTQHAQQQASGLKEYYENQGGWKIFGKIMKNPFDSITELLFGDGGGNPDEDDDLKGTGIDGLPRGAGSGKLDVKEGGGKLTGLSEDDYKWLAYGISGEAGGGDDMYAVAASILNRYATGKYDSIEDIIKAPGQYEAYEKGTLRFMPDVAANFQSDEGQAKMVAALELLHGRGDFRGQELLHNRVENEDPMVDPSGNYYLYGWQGSGKNAQKPANWSPPTNYQKFIEKSNSATGMDIEATNAFVEGLLKKNGIDPDSIQPKTQEIRGPREVSQVPATDVLQTASVVDMNSRQLSLAPLFASLLPQSQQQQQQSDPGQAFALAASLATGGSSSTGLNPFSMLSVLTL